MQSFHEIPEIVFENLVDDIRRLSSLMTSDSNNNEMKHKNCYMINPMKNPDYVKKIMMARFMSNKGINTVYQNLMTKIPTYISYYIQ